MSSSRIKHIILFFFFFNSSIILSQEITSYYLIRHAEKNLMNPDNKNPHLTEQGKIRASNWKKIFKYISFDKIYSTNYSRTLETAKPTAEDKGILVEKYNPKKLYEELLIEKNKGKKILVVGHSNTIPVLANILIGEDIYNSIDESIHGNLYIINIINNKVTYELLNLE